MVFIVFSFNDHYFAIPNPDILLSGVDIVNSIAIDEFLYDGIGYLYSESALHGLELKCKHKHVYKSSENSFISIRNDYGLYYTWSPSSNTNYDINIDGLLTKLSNIGSLNSGLWMYDQGFGMCKNELVEEPFILDISDKEFNDLVYVIKNRR